MRKALQNLLAVIIVCAMVYLPMLWAIAVVQSCGWMGFFVECRITSAR